MTYIVSYDIKDDTVRNRIARILEGFGIRVQWSVFECRVEPEELKKLISRVEGALLSPERGNIRIYRVCAECHAASQGIGDIVSVGGEESCLIV